MKQLFIFLISALMLFSTSTVFAGGNNRHYGHHSSHHYGHRSNHGTYLLGGFLLGSLLTDVYHRSHYYRSYPVERRIYYTPQVVDRNLEVPANYYLFQDMQGNCFKIQTLENGDELRSELPRSECRR